MKKLIVIIVMFFSLMANAQDSLLSYTEVVQMPGIAKSEIFSRAREWFNATFKSSKDALQIVDKESGELSGNGSIVLKERHKLIVGSQSSIFDCIYVTTVWAKDGKYKYEFSSIKVREGYNAGTNYILVSSSDKSPFKIGLVSSKSFDDKVWAGMKKSIDNFFNVLSSSLKESMNTKNDKSNF